MSYFNREEGEIMEADLNLTRKSLNSKSKRAVTVGVVDENKKTLIITQKVETKKQKTKIVLPDNKLMKHKITMGTEYSKRLEEIQVTVSERILPACYRPRCSSDKKIKRTKYSQKRPKPKKSPNPKINGKRQTNNVHDKTKKNSKDIKEHSLSPISFSSLEGINEEQISYEDVSSDSFTSCSDSELDTLIKRTKQRETHMTVSSKFLCERPPHSSTPYSDMDIISEDDSIHSQVTVKLDIPTQSCEAGSLQLFGTNEDKSITVPQEMHVSGQPSEDIQTKHSGDPEAHFIYYHYHNVSKNTQNNAKIEKNNNIYTDKHIINLKKNHIG